MKISRREVMKTVGTLGIMAVGTKAAADIACGLTPVQPEGPFYPVDKQLDTDNDLTRVAGKAGAPLGDVIYIQGVVSDDQCQPVSGALVEIWQACSSGKYNHRADPNPAPLDPNFQYWGKAVTDAAGRYRFKTILPGAYPADVNWMRPPHIHYKVSKLGFRELITQLYFKGQRLNAQDLILQELPATEQQKVIVELRAPQGGYDPRAKIGTFNISLRKLVR